MVLLGRRKSAIRPNSPESPNKRLAIGTIAILAFSNLNLERFLQRIAIFTATRWEFLAIQKAMPGGRITRVDGLRQYTADWPGMSATVIQTGIGLQKAQTACHHVLAKAHYDLAISSGFAAALTSSSIGSLVIPKVVVLGKGGSSEGRQLFSYPCSVEYSSVVHYVAEHLHRKCLSGVLVTVGWIVWSALEKQALAQEYHANAVDMESAGIAAVTLEHHIPFLVIRTVSDLQDETLPQEFILFLSPATWKQGLWQMVTRPALWGHVARLRRQTKVASKELTRFFEMFVGHLRQGEGAQS